MKYPSSLHALPTIRAPTNSTITIYSRSTQRIVTLFQMDMEIAPCINKKHSILLIEYVKNDNKNNGSGYRMPPTLRLYNFWYPVRVPVRKIILNIAVDWYNYGLCNNLVCHVD